MSRSHNQKRAESRTSTRHELSEWKRKMRRKRRRAGWPRNTGAWWNSVRERHSVEL